MGTFTQTPVDDIAKRLLCTLNLAPTGDPRGPFLAPTKGIVPYPTFFVEWHAPKIGVEVDCFQDAIRAMSEWTAVTGNTDGILGLDALMRVNTDLRFMRLLRRSQRKQLRVALSNDRRVKTKLLEERCMRLRSFIFHSRAGFDILKRISPNATLAHRSEFIAHYEFEALHRVDIRIQEEVEKLRRKQEEVEARPWKFPHYSADRGVIHRLEKERSRYVRCDFDKDYNLVGTYHHRAQWAE